MDHKLDGNVYYFMNGSVYKGVELYRGLNYIVISNLRQHLSGDIQLSVSTLTGTCLEGMGKG